MYAQILNKSLLVSIFCILFLIGGCNSGWTSEYEDVFMDGCDDGYNTLYCQCVYDKLTIKYDSADDFDKVGFDYMSDVIVPECASNYYNY